MKISVGCGNKKIPGYIGVDAVARSAADIVAPVTAIPLDDNVADEILGVHIAEHLTPWEFEDALIEWKRLLKPGGALILELPNLWKCCENLISGFKKDGKHPDQMGMFGIYGDPRDQDPFMLHKYGYSPASMTVVLERHGFTNISEQPTQWHRTGKLHRDMRIEATAP